MLNEGETVGDVVVEPITEATHDVDAVSSDVSHDIRETANDVTSVSGDIASQVHDAPPIYATKTEIEEWKSGLDAKLDRLHTLLSDVERKTVEAANTGKKGKRSTYAKKDAGAGSDTTGTNTPTTPNTDTRRPTRRRGFRRY